MIVFVTAIPKILKVCAILPKGVPGVADTAKAAKVPIIAGNVSLYNESNGVSIAPSPMIAMVGKLEDVKGCSFSLSFTKRLQLCCW